MSCAVCSTGLLFKKKRDNIQIIVESFSKFKKDFIALLLFFLLHMGCVYS